MDVAAALCQARQRRRILSRRQAPTPDRRQIRGREIWQTLTCSIRRPAKRSPWSPKSRYRHRREGGAREVRNAILLEHLADGALSADLEARRTARRERRHDRRERRARASFTVRSLTSSKSAASETGIFAYLACCPCPSWAGRPVIIARCQVSR